ncbi:hypothetical protein BDR07DRAFT_1199519, partial [Suillus spraguei]
HHNWCNTDWDKFNEHLSNLLSLIPPRPLVSDEEFQQEAHRVMQAIISTIESTVPIAKPCPHSKHWWMRELTNLQKQVNELSHTAY